MPRPVRFTPETILDRALPIFWDQGFLGTSIDDLTRSVGASRQAIYSAFPDKRALLLACIDSYKCLIVDPAFSIVEQPRAGLREIANYFEVQISASETAGLPSAGCLLGNLTTELAPHDPQVERAVRSHLTRLRTGFLRALQTACGQQTATDLEAWAELLTVTAQGLWSTARVTRDASELRRPVRALLELIEGAMTK